MSKIIFNYTKEELVKSVEILNTIGAILKEALPEQTNSSDIKALSKYKDICYDASKYINLIAQDIESRKDVILTKRWTSFLPGEDITIVWEDVFKNEDLISTELISWYFGEDDRDINLIERSVFQEY